MDEPKTKQAQIILPENIVSSADLLRMLRELKNLDDFMHQAAIRKTGKSMSLPKLGSLLEEYAKLNSVSLLDEKQRKNLIEQTEQLKNQSPSIHMSFAVDPSAAFMGKIVEWARKSIHPTLLIEKGLQPTIAAGVVVRTNNKVFDLSLRQSFQSKKQVLIDKLGEKNER